MAFTPTESLARKCARHPWLTIALWAMILAITGALAALILPGVITSDIEFTGTPESKRADDIIAEYFPDSTAVSELAIVTNEEIDLDHPDFRSYVESLKHEILALGDDVIDVNTKQ